MPSKFSNYQKNYFLILCYDLQVVTDSPIIVIALYLVVAVLTLAIQ